MSDLLRRRRAMMEKKSDVLDTSPKIEEYNKRLHRTQDVVVSNGACYTKWIIVDPIPRANAVMVWHNMPTETYESMFQWEEADGSLHYYYYSSRELRKNTTRIRFTLLTEKLADCYAYAPQTGQIFFAGKNTPYYGYTNINDMPQG